MRMLMKVTIPVEKGNESIADGTLPQVVQRTLETLRPEAAYFYPENGRRTALMVFDLKDASEIPVIAEPFFTALNANIDFTPVMNAQDLQAGLGKLTSKR